MKKGAHAFSHKAVGWRRERSFWESPAFFLLILCVAPCPPGHLGSGQLKLCVQVVTSMPINELLCNGRVAAGLWDFDFGLDECAVPSAEQKSFTLRIHVVETRITLSLSLVSSVTRNARVLHHTHSLFSIFSFLCCDPLTSLKLTFFESVSLICLWQSESSCSDLLYLYPM